MNQILYTKETKQKRPFEKKTIFRILGILSVVFGICLIGGAVFFLIKQPTLEKGASIPSVTVTSNGATLSVKVKHDKIIDKLIYQWNETQEVVLQGKGRLEIEEIIQIPTGSNTFMLKVTDVSGKTASYSEVYEKAEGDTIQPEIELLVEGSKVKIVVKDETELDYIKYYWNQEDETKVEVREESPKQIEEKISILKGENTLTIVAVDKAGNETTKEQAFIGAKKPTIDLAREGNVLIMKIADETGLQKVEYTLNGQYYSTDPNNTGAALNMKELEIKQPLVQGENKITIKAYNIAGLTEELSGETTI